MTPADSTAPGIAVVMVNWNGWRDTLEALASLKASDHVDWRLYVVDNASADDSVGQLSAHAPEARLIASPVNDGFAGGCNRGIAAALADGADAVFLLNNDAAVRPDTLSALAAASAAHPNAVLGAAVRYKMGGGWQFFGSRADPGTGAPEWFRHPDDAGVLGAAMIPTDFVFGAALFAPARLFREIGLFDERFFLTYEETDWCYRARAAGAECFVVRDAVVEHVGSASLGSAASPLQAYFLQRNRLLFWQKHAGARRLLRGIKGDLRWLSQGFGGDLRALARGHLPDPTRRARFAAWRDWALRRFGDCPPGVRRLRAAKPA